MPETKNDFMLLAVHTDKEFTYWLNRHAEEGWWLKENKGNTFVFIKRPYPGKRICSYTVSSDVLGVSAEEAFYEQQDELRKNGWQLLAMGMPENLTDNRRSLCQIRRGRRPCCGRRSGKRCLRSLFV